MIWSKENLELGIDLKLVLEDQSANPIKLHTNSFPNDQIAFLDSQSYLQNQL